MNEANVSRRNLMLAGGAMLALSACDGKATGQKAKDGPLKDLGYGPSNGDDANLGFPKNPESTPVAFNPGFITLVRVSSNGAWNLTANHASFVTSETDYDKRKALAGEILRHFKGIFPKGNKKIARLSELKGQTKDYGIAMRNDRTYDRTDFVDFDFGHQHEIYVWFDSPAVTLAEKTATKGGPLLITMTHNRADGTPTAVNRSFYAEAFEPQKYKPDGPIIVVRNYFRDENGDPITKPGLDLKYSMNIYFQLKNISGKVMTLILDPDTGNGTGYDPFTNT